MHWVFSIKLPHKFSNSKSLLMCWLVSKIDLLLPILQDFAKIIISLIIVEYLLTLSSLHMHILLLSLCITFWSALFSSGLLLNTILSESVPIQRIGFLFDTKLQKTCIFHNFIGMNSDEQGWKETSDQKNSMKNKTCESKKPTFNLTSRIILLLTRQVAC